MLGGEFPAGSKGRLSWPGPAFVRAIQLAESGAPIDCLTVESALAVEGYAEAFEVFKDDRLRAGIINIGDQLQKEKLTTIDLLRKAGQADPAL